MRRQSLGHWALVSVLSLLACCLVYSLTGRARLGCPGPGGGAVGEIGIICDLGTVLSGLSTYASLVPNAPGRGHDSQRTLYPEDCLGSSRVSQPHVGKLRQKPWPTVSHRLPLPTPCPLLPVWKDGRSDAIRVLHPVWFTGHPLGYSGFEHPHTGAGGSSEVARCGSQKGGHTRGPAHPAQGPGSG